MFSPTRQGSSSFLAGLAALLLAACQAHTVTASFGGAVGTRPAAPAGTSSSAEPVQSSPAPGARPTGDTTATLFGCSVEEATRRARDKGYTKDIEVIPLREFQAGCQPATVCRVSPRLWEFVGNSLTLYVNRQLTITGPN